VIDDCDNWWNQFLTLLGFIHICYQPYFTHVLNSSLTKVARVYRCPRGARCCRVSRTHTRARALAVEARAVDVRPDSAPYAPWRHRARPALLPCRLVVRGPRRGSIRRPCALLTPAGAFLPPGGPVRTCRPRLNTAADSCTGLSTEWLRGEKLCTFSGKYHLAWSVPMSDVSYYTCVAALCGAGPLSVGSPLLLFFWPPAARARRSIRS
jgi:hypothetical protein